MDSALANSLFDGHRRFLPAKHHWPSNLEFSGKTERRPPPCRLTTTDTLQQLHHVKNTVPSKDPTYGGIK